MPAFVTASNWKLADIMCRSNDSIAIKIVKIPADYENNDEMFFLLLGHLVQQPIHWKVTLTNAPFTMVEFN